MSTLTDFLLARIEEDEALATSAHDDDSRNTWTLGIDGGSSLSPGDRVAYHPSRARAECEAKRRILECAEEASGLDMQIDGEFRVGARDTVAEPYVGDLIIRALALPYADHPDYPGALGVAASC
jgi:hypothetical protein